LYHQVNSSKKKASNTSSETRVAECVENLVYMHPCNNDADRLMMEYTASSVTTNHYNIRIFKKLYKDN